MVRTVSPRVGTFINSCYKKKAEGSEYFSLYLNELADATDTAQLLFTWGSSARFEVTAELGSIVCVEQLQVRNCQRSWENL